MAAWFNECCAFVPWFFLLVLFNFVTYVLMLKLSIELCTSSRDMCSSCCEGVRERTNRQTDKNVIFILKNQPF